MQSISSAETPLVMIVDDIKEIVEELMTMLNLFNTSSVGAHCLADAIAQLKIHTSIRVVCCDVRLGGDAGEEIIDRVAEDAALSNRDLHFIFMTADVMRFAQQANISGHPIMAKPMKPKDLLAAIEQFL